MKNMWIVPINPVWFNAVDYLDYWVENQGFEYGVYRSLGLDSGDLIYFYLSSPIQKVLFVGEVIDVDHDPINNPEIKYIRKFMTKEQRIEADEKYSEWEEKPLKKIYTLKMSRFIDDDAITFEQIKLCGLRNIRRATKINTYEKLVNILQGEDEEIDMFDFSEFE